MWYQDFENETERLEREAVQAGAEYAGDPRDELEATTVCCPSPAYAARTLCACGGVPYV